ncbi:MAG: radical SAM protein [Desulfovibrionaceae bacterium]
MKEIPLPHIEKSSLRILPVFIPFAGCPERCTFCNQEAQTGLQEEINTNAYYNSLERSLHEMFLKNRHCEIAFFGGTFTALNRKIQERFLSLANTYKDKGIVKRIRCSTRPDCINDEILSFVKQRGMDCIELGIQSFKEEALWRTNRNYSQAKAIESCYAIQRYNIELGIQLMVGMPGTNIHDFLHDMDITIRISPKYLRLYPCLVIKNTELEKEYKQNLYIPWSAEVTIDALTTAQYLAWKHSIHVLRIGVAPEKDLDQNIIAGIWEASLGNRIQARALQRYILEQQNNVCSTEHCILPEHYKGFFWGHRKECMQEYNARGIFHNNICFKKDLSKNNLYIYG